MISVDEVFQFLGEREKLGSQPGLERVRHLLDLLNNPEFNEVIN